MHTKSLSAAGWGYGSLIYLSKNKPKHAYSALVHLRGLHWRTRHLNLLPLSGMDASCVPPADEAGPCALAFARVSGFSTGTIDLYSLI